MCDCIKYVSMLCSLKRKYRTSAHSVQIAGGCVVVHIFLMHTSLVSHLAVDIALQGLLAQLNS